MDDGAPGDPAFIPNGSFVVDDLTAFKTGGLAVDERTAPSLRITPNPCTERIRITAPIVADGTPFTLLSPSGAVVRTGRSFRSELDVRDLPAGVYVLEIGAEGTPAVQRARLVKQ